MDRRQAGSYGMKQDRRPSGNFEAPVWGIVAHCDFRRRWNCHVLEHRLRAKPRTLLRMMLWMFEARTSADDRRPETYRRHSYKSDSED